MYKQVSETKALQPDLFSTGILCSHCNQDPGRDPRNGYTWNGFLDKETSERVCCSCKNIHYQKKQQKLFNGEPNMTYSEMPIVVPTNQRQ
jgi:hypothetical protein